MKSGDENGISSHRDWKLWIIIAQIIPILTKLMTCTKKSQFDRLSLNSPPLACGSCHLSTSMSSCSCPCPCPCPCILCTAVGTCYLCTAVGACYLCLVVQALGGPIGLKVRLLQVLVVYNGRWTAAYARGCWWRDNKYIEMGRHRNIKMAM